MRHPALPPATSLSHCFPSGLSFPDTLCLLFCRVGAAGLAPVAPGTWGTLVATLFAPIWFLPMPFLGRIFVLGALLFLGALASTRAEKLLYCKDPSQIVIDEFVGLWLVLLPFAKVSPTELALAFILFRFFDIVKPWPVGASEQWMRSGYGIMLDDIMAGLLAMLCLGVWRYIS